MSAIEIKSIVRIGKGASIYEVLRFSTDDRGPVALLGAVTRKIGGGYERSAYMPGRHMHPVVPVARLVAVER